MRQTKTITTNQRNDSHTTPISTTIVFFTELTVAAANAGNVGRVGIDPGAPMPPPYGVTGGKLPGLEYADWWEEPIGASRSRDRDRDRCLLASVDIFVVC